MVGKERTNEEVSDVIRATGEEDICAALGWTEEDYLWTSGSPHRMRLQ